MSKDFIFAKMVNRRFLLLFIVNFWTVIYSLRRSLINVNIEGFHLGDILFAVNDCLGNGILE